MTAIRVGISPPLEGWAADLGRREWAAAVADAGLDHVFVADHVSFRDGSGMDGLVRAASLLSLHGGLGVFVGVYLLALRHPVLVARQLATIAEDAPGRLTLGVGIGGEDRHEFEVVEVDPATRGRRTDEALDLLLRLLTGEAVEHHGEHFSVRGARIVPAPDPPVPIVIGGRSDAALRRAGRFGDGWLAAWCTPERFVEAVGMVEAEGAGRGVAWQHGYQNWVGIGGRGPLAAAMEDFYHVPFERFERYTPHGSVDEIAGYLRPFAAAGCRTFNLTPIGGTQPERIESVAAIRDSLRSTAIL
ncbi:MAG: LLM class flavin-dependent oxidoreductase [Actinobacteria bacterium]|nr:MAG: LLM class flavin-dependent oxidoreductase [Actinomycetota bacterium]